MATFWQAPLASAAEWGKGIVSKSPIIRTETKTLKLSDHDFADFA
jgi:hypothetical protein